MEKDASTIGTSLWSIFQGLLAGDLIGDGGRVPAGCYVVVLYSVRTSPNDPHYNVCCIFNTGSNLTFTFPSTIKYTKN